MVNFDLKGLKEMAEGSEDFLLVMLKSFCSKTPIELEALEEACEQNDFDKVTRIAHKIKPSIDMLEIQELMPLIRKIEKGGKIEEVKMDIETLSIGISQVIETLRKEYDGL